MDDLDWNRPCNHGCIVGKPRGMATNGACQHAREMRHMDAEALRHTLGVVLRSRAGIVEELRRLQRGEQIESDHVDPFAWGGVSDE